MTAWEILIAGSTLQSGTAWQHLNAQGGGGGGDIFIYGELEVELMSDEFEVELAGDYEVVPEGELTVELEDETM